MIATAPPARLETLLPLLACPACSGSLQPEADALACVECRGKYPIIAGRPTFLPGSAPPRIMPVEHISNPIPTLWFDWLVNFDGWVLNLGAGGTRVKLKNCVEMEYALFRHTDVAADAHQLPFGEAVFDAVVSFNTFEHLANPERVAAEIQRVLKPGGRVIIQTAFLQLLHEAPHHYYNATEYGLRRWFQGFDIKEVKVPGNFHPAYAFAWLTSELLRAVEAEHGPAERRVWRPRRSTSGARAGARNANNAPRACGTCSGSFPRRPRSTRRWISARCPQAGRDRGRAGLKEKDTMAKSEERTRMNTDGVTIAIPNWNHEVLLPRSILSALRALAVLRGRVCRARSSSSTISRATAR